MKASKTGNQQRKKAAKEHRMANPGYKSLYSRKRSFLHRHGGMGIDYPDKPWK